MSLVAILGILLMIGGFLLLIVSIIFFIDAPILAGFLHDMAAANEYLQMFIFAGIGGIVALIVGFLLIKWSADNS